MTLVQVQARSAGTPTERRATAVVAEEAGLRVWADMTVEVALSVMAGARVAHLVVCDDDGLRTGMVTRARLTVVRDGSGYTDRTRLRDVPVARAG